MLIFFFLILHSHIKKMLNFLYDGFVALYDAIIPQNHTLASEHALRQEQDNVDNLLSLLPRQVIFRSSYVSHLSSLIQTSGLLS